MIAFLLIHHNVLRRPLLYLSYYLKRYRTEYYESLTAIRDRGDWEGWLRFFLRGVAETAREATDTAHAILSLRERHRALIQERGLGMNGLSLLDLLFQQPLININVVRDSLGITHVSVGRLVHQFEQAGLLQEITGGQRYRRYRYTSYLALFDEPSETDADAEGTQRAENRGERVDEAT